MTARAQVELPELPGVRECVSFRWLGEPINEHSDALWCHANHWSSPPWKHKEVECLYTADQMHAYARQAIAESEARAEGLLALLQRIRNDVTWRTNDNALWRDILAAIDAAQEAEREAGSA